MEASDRVLVSLPYPVTAAMPHYRSKWTRDHEEIIFRHEESQEYKQAVTQGLVRGVPVTRPLSESDYDECSHQPGLKRQRLPSS